MLIVNNSELEILFFTNRSLSQNMQIERLLQTVVTVL